MKTPGSSARTRKLPEYLEAHEVEAIIRALDPDHPISYKEIQSVFENRNMIAHGRSRCTMAETMADIIAMARRVRGVLNSLEGLD